MSILITFHFYITYLSSKKDLLKYCFDLRLYLTGGESKDLNGLRLRDELDGCGVFVNEKINNHKTLEFIYSNNLDGNLPNIGRFPPLDYSITDFFLSKIDNYLHYSMPHYLSANINRK